MEWMLIFLFADTYVSALVGLLNSTKNLFFCTHS